MTLSYSSFLVLFVGLPLLAVVFWKRRELPALDWRAMGWLLLIVYAATTPWDNAAVRAGLWDFEPSRILGIRLGWLPVEEYLFFGLQTLLTGTWVLARLRRLHQREAT